jgi:hypothetical protein
VQALAPLLAGPPSDGALPDLDPRGEPVTPVAQALAMPSPVTNDGSAGGDQATAGTDRSFGKGLKVEAVRKAPIPMPQAPT